MGVFYFQPDFDTGLQETANLGRSWQTSFMSRPFYRILSFKVKNTDEYLPVLETLSGFGYHLPKIARAGFGLPVIGRLINGWK